MTRKPLRMHLVGLALVGGALTAPGIAHADPPPPLDPAPSTDPPPPPAAVTAPALSPASTASTASTTHLAPYVAAGVAVVAAGVGATFGVLALNAKSEFEAHPTLSNADRGNNDAAYCDASLGAAVLAGITSVVFFLTERDAPPSVTGSTPPEPPPPPHLSWTAVPLLSPHGVGAGATLRF